MAGSFVGESSDTGIATLFQQSEVGTGNLLAGGIRFLCYLQCCGSGSGWIRNQIARLYPDPDPASEIEL
jgi:hypothetical protein